MSLKRRRLRQHTGAKELTAEIGTYNIEGKGRLLADSERGGGDRPPTRINTRRNRNHRPNLREREERKREQYVSQRQKEREK